MSISKSVQGINCTSILVFEIKSNASFEPWDKLDGFFTMSTL